MPVSFKTIKTVFVTMPSEPLLFKTTLAGNGTATVVPVKVQRCVEILTNTKTKKYGIRIGPCNSLSHHRTIAFWDSIKTRQFRSCDNVNINVNDFTGKTIASCSQNFINLYEHNIYHRCKRQYSSKSQLNDATADNLTIPHTDS